MARLEQVITTMVEVFLEYADNQGKKKMLCKDELQALLQTEIESPELKVGTIKKVTCSVSCQNNSNRVFLRAR